MAAVTVSESYIHLISKNLFSWGNKTPKGSPVFLPRRTEVYGSTEGKMKVDFFIYYYYYFFYYAVLLTRGINNHHPGYIIAFSLDRVFATKERRAAFISAFAAHVKAQPGSTYPETTKHGRSTVSIFSPSNISSIRLPVFHIKLVNLYRSKKIWSLGNRILTTKKRNLHSVRR